MFKLSETRIGIWTIILLFISFLVVFIDLPFLNSIIDSFQLNKIISIILTSISFVILYLSKKIMRFVINPPTLIYVEDKPFKITPWIQESQIRWETNLKRIFIVTSKSIRLQKLQLCELVLIDNFSIKNSSIDRFRISENKELGKNTYVIETIESQPITINFYVLLEIERDEEQEELRPFVEYSIEYKYTRIPLLFFDSSRIT